MISPGHNERSDDSKAGTFGLHASNVEKERKRKKSCSTDAQLKRQRIDRKRKRSSDEESEPANYRMKTSELYPASGLKSSLHGVAYQLKLLMLFLKRGVDQEYPFRLATEMDAAEKFDDLVFQYSDGEKTVHRFLQAKHKQNEAEQISIHDLLTDTKKKLNLQKYFISYRKIMRNTEFNGINNKIKDLIICTNIDFKWDDKRGALTLRDDIFHRERDETILKTDLRRFKKDFDGRKEIVSALENATDLIKLAKNLAGCVLDGKCTKKGEAEKKTSDDFLESYRSPLEEEVIDKDRKKLRREFVICAESLSLEAKNFWQAIEKVFRDQRKTYNLHADPVIKREDLDEFARVVAALIQKDEGSGIIKIHKRKNVIKENFDKLAGYVLVKKAEKIRLSLAFLNKGKLPGNLDDFRKKLLAELSKKNINRKDIAKYTFNVYKGFQTCDEIYVNMNNFWEVIGEKDFDLFGNFDTRDANLESVDAFVENLVHLIEKSQNNGEPNVEIKKENKKIFKNMIKLAKCAKLIEESDGIRFSREFLEDTRLPDNLNEFRDRLKARIEDLGELRFVINNFPKTRLPSDSITDIESEIDSFLDKLVFAVDQPNEIVLGNTINAEMGKCRDINLIDSEFLASNFQRYVFDWMKNKDGRFLTCVEGKDFFDEMANKLTTLQLTWTTREYSVHMKEINIRFTKDKDEKELREFLKPENTMQLFILMSMPNTILGLIQVHQILETIPDYQKNDGYIFLRLNSFSRMQDSVFDALASRSKRLLIIECKSNEVNERASYRELLEAMESKNLGKIILITEKDGPLVDQFKRKFVDRSVEKKVEVNSLLDLENESREKIIKERIVKFQGQEVPLSTLMINKESMNLINAEALAKLINNETLEIGKCLEDLGDVKNYYISRSLQRPEKIDQSFLEDTSRFYVITNNQLKDFDSQQNQDIVVISDNNKLFQKLINEENCKKHNIHWLKLENSQYIWQESNGTVSNLRNFVDSDNVESFSPEKVTDISNKIAIIAAEPGMGKSTMLTHLSVQTKESEPTVWVAKINLSVDCSKKLKEMVRDGMRFDDEKTIDFLLTSAKFTSEMPEYQFLNYCYKTGNMILLFDGFDEISPHYNNKVIELLKFLKGTRVKKIWVTTRPYDIKTNLEDELGSFSYVLKEFSENDQRRFLREYWTAELNFDNFDVQRADVFIDTLLKSFSKTINDCQRKFISIPLQIKMIADVCKDTFQNFNESTEENIADLEKKLEENMELLSLYNNFFEVKFERIYFEEKRPGLNDANSYSRGTIEIEREHNIEIHEILALENLYPNNLFTPRKKVIRLLKDIKRSKNKTGIIDRVVNDKPVFVHKSFAEYFVALWFSKNWQEENVKQLLKERIFSEESIVIQNFFDRMLASNELESSESQEFSTEQPQSANVYKLHNAVLNNDGSGVQKLLNDDESLFYKTDTAGRNLLHLAAARGHEGIARSFLEAVRKRADHNVVTHPLRVKDELFQWTPLTYADKCNHWNVAEMFLQTGSAGEDMFEAIKNIGSKIGDLEETLLHKAAREGYLKIAALLLKKGASIDVCDNTGWTPIESALRAPHSEIVQYFFMQKKANSDIVGGLEQTALHFAASKTNLGMAEYLTKAADESGRTDLHLAALKGHLEEIKYLVDEKNADFKTADKSGLTALHFAALEGHLEVIKYLVDEKNADFEAADELGRTALRFAALKGHLGVIKYLVDEKNADFEATDESGRTALHSAAERRNWETVKYLVDEKNANFEAADESGCTVLHMAAENGELELVKYLVDEKNADFEAADTSGCTTLHYAAEMRNWETVKYLVDKKNANFEAADESGCTVLHMAAKNGELELVKYLVDEKNTDFEAADKSGRTALYFAAEKRNWETVKYLVDKKNANFEAANSLGRTVLHMAAENGELEVIRYLVDKKNPDFEAADESGLTALHFAAFKGHLEVIKYLVDEKNADFEAVEESGRTALHFAALEGHLEVIKYLVDKKNADFEAADKLGCTVLHMAAKNGEPEVIEYLVDEKNADFKTVEESGRTALHFAALKGHLEVIKYLVDEKNADFETADKSGCTVLHMAAKSGQLELVEYLVDEKNADFEAADESGRTTLHFAAEMRNWETVKYLVDKKNANFEAANSLGRTVLHMAAENGELEVIRYLVDKKNPDFEAADESGLTALHFAAFKGHLEVIKYLVDKKNADFEAADKLGCTVLHMAAKNGEPEVIEYLVDEKNADFEAVEESGRTALHFAALKGHLEVIKYLVDEKNADFETADKSGCTVLHMAAKSGQLELVEYLVDEKNADFEAADESGRTTLHFAAEMRNWETVKYLVDKKNANFEAANCVGRTVLHMAAENGELELVKYLVDEKNADFETADKSGCTVLHMAAKSGKLELVEYLVDEKNADFETADKLGCTVLHMAAENGKLELVKYLVDKKNANFEAADESGCTVLHMAAKSGELELVKYLVDEKNANFEAADESGCTVLHMAAENEEPELVKYLVDEKNTDFEAADKSGRTALHFAALKRNLEVIKYLVDEKNARFEAADESGCTVLHLSALEGHLRVIKYLVDEKNADFEAVEGSGRTALHFAALKGHLEVVKYLVDKKNANFEAADESGCTVLHFAALEGHLDVIKYLVKEKNADFETADKSGRTALHLADSEGHLEVIEYLVDEKNARFEAADESGCTVLHMAAEN